MNKVLVIAPHPDDETLGCGGTLLKHINDGDSVNWLIMTSMQNSDEYDEDQKQKQISTIDSVAKAYPFNKFHQAQFQTSLLDSFPKIELIKEISSFIKRLEPSILYLPHPHDIHSDHEAVFSAAISCSKSFRYPYIKKVRVYETLSETDFSLSLNNNGFNPNLFIDISDYLERKVEIMKLFEGEIKDHPFPRSERSINSLASLRGAVAGCEYAESFISLKEIL